MNIKQRINARKIVLGYFYQHCFFSKLENNKFIIKEILELSNVFISQEEYVGESVSFLKKVGNYVKFNNNENDLEYYIRVYFDQWKEEDIDMDYVFSVGTSLEKYIDELKNLVNKYIKTFSYDRMDTIDQALFLLGYVEWKVLGTPKEILLNEMIELGKRYADFGSTKLINGIMHKILVGEKK